MVMPNIPFQERYREENRRLGALAARLGGPVTQPIDPDDPPLPCGCTGCGRDATVITRLRVGTSDEYGITACDRHVEAMFAAVAAAAK